MRAPATFRGPALQADRERAGVSRADLAARIGVSVRTISNWERGKSAPGTAHQLLIEDALNESLLNGKVPVDWRGWWEGAAW